MSKPLGGRRHAQALHATVHKQEDGHMLLRPPRPGYFRSELSVGTIVQPGDALGHLEVLGTVHLLLAPAGAFGRAVDLMDEGVGRLPVDTRSSLCRLDAESIGIDAEAEEALAAEGPEGQLAFVFPLAGRYYARPSPEAECFVNVGDVVSSGQTVGIIEVMKTFNRINYGGAGMPAQARVMSIGPDDGADVESGDRLLGLEPV